MKQLLAWHFTDGMKLRDGDDLVVGKTYRHKGTVEICESGYHASERLIDALQHAPGAQISRVAVWGDVKRQDDKLVARNRKVLWTIDATKILHFFACAVAEDALKKIDNPDPRSLAAIETKRRWLDGKATDKELNAAESAARSAAWSAAESAAWSAAWSAAESAARSAAESAARSAAWSAAESAARSAAWSAARSAAESAAWSAAESAARSAAWSAAWSAARSAAWSAAWSALDEMLTETVNTAHDEAVK